MSSFVEGIFLSLLILWDISTTYQFFKSYKEEREKK